MSRGSSILKLEYSHRKRQEFSIPFFPILNLQQETQESGRTPKYIVESDPARRSAMRLVRGLSIGFGALTMSQIKLSWRRALYVPPISLFFRLPYFTTTLNNMGSISQGEDLAEIFQRLSDAYKSVSSGPNVSPKAKAQLRVAAQELIGAISAPHENAMLFALQNAVHPCYRIAADCGIFFDWKNETMTAKELAEKTGADQRLVGM